MADGFEARLNEAGIMRTAEGRRCFTVLHYQYLQFFSFLVVRTTCHPRCRLRFSLSDRSLAKSCDYLVASPERLLKNVRFSERWVMAAFAMDVRRHI